MNTAFNGIAQLPHLGVIRVEGEDAAKFLHGQLTQDFMLLGQNEARLSAFCSAKGRMLASFVCFKRGQGDILMLCSRDLLAPTLQRLRMFVMRAKARLSDASDRFVVRGLAGSALPEGIAASTPWTKMDLAGAQLVVLYPADGAPRALWIAPLGEPEPLSQPLSTADWLLSEVRSGVATITGPLVEAFVPQMLNYESIGGVNFKKGCYPGQEVVARSQFRGILKRRAFLAHSESPMAAGQHIFQSGDADQPCATVVQAARSSTGNFEAIVSGQIAALQSQGLHAGSVDGPALQIEAMPYALLEDI